MPSIKDVGSGISTSAPSGFQWSLVKCKLEGCKALLQQEVALGLTEVSGRLSPVKCYDCQQGWAIFDSKPLSLHCFHIMVSESVFSYRHPPSAVGWQTAYGNSRTGWTRTTGIARAQESLSCWLVKRWQRLFISQGSLKDTCCPFETCVFPPKSMETTIYKAMFRCIM